MKMISKFQIVGFPYLTNDYVQASDVAEINTLVGWPKSLGRCWQFIGLPVGQRTTRDHRCVNRGLLKPCWHDDYRAIGGSVILDYVTILSKNIQHNPTYICDDQSLAGMNCQTEILRESARRDPNTLAVCILDNKMTGQNPWNRRSKTSWTRA
jgi:hypothetical protein